jgi:hypothetical protein
MLLKCSRSIEAPAAELFALTQEYGGGMGWVAFSSDARLLGASTPARGVVVRHFSFTGSSMDTVYTGVVCGTAVAQRMLHGPHFIKKFAVGFRFRALTTSTTLVNFNYAIALAPGWLAFLVQPLLLAVVRIEIQRKLWQLQRRVKTRRTMAWSR